MYDPCVLRHLKYKMVENYQWGWFDPSYISSSSYELCSFSKLLATSPTSQLILIIQAFRHFTYVTAHSPTHPSLYLRHNSFSNPSVASPTSQLILQSFFRLSYVTGFSLTSPGEPPMLPGPEIEPGSPAVCADALTAELPGQVQIHDRIYLLSLSSLA